MKFLDALALQICNAQHPALHRVEIIFPAVRPVAPFLHALSRRLGKPSLAPACHALEEWAYKCSGLRRPNRLHLISLLHQAYLHAVKQDGSVPDRPEQFLAWASGLLGDFEEVDSYVLPSEAYPFPAEQVFRYLHQQKAIEIWNPSGEEPTQTEMDYLHFYKLIYPIYLEFRRLLEAEGVDYPSGALRTVLNSINAKAETNHQADAMYWVGFDHVTPLLQRVIEGLYGTTKVYWIADNDRYYHDNNVHLAGHWLRQLPTTKPFSEGIPAIERLSKGIPVLNQCTCSGTMEQIDAGIEQIKIWLNAGIEPAQIGWVIGESTQVWPLLLRWDLPETGLHLDMPLDLRWTCSYSWAMAYLEILQALHFKGKVISVDWNKWINNPLWASLNLGPTECCGDSNNKPTFLYAESLRSYQYQGIPLLPSYSEQSKVGPDPNAQDKATQTYLHLAQLALTLSEHKENGVAPMEQHALRSLAALVHQITGQMLPSENPWTVWRKMWALHLGSAALNPEGNAIGGIRIMSLSDTLAMDFDYLVFSGLNEGVLPRPGRYRGMLSFDLRRHFDLPEPWAEEARQAYTFYRLLQHCSEAWLIYAHSGADGKVAEKSRFLQQLDLEYRGTIQATYRDLPVNLPPASDHSITIPKTEAVLNLIRQKLTTKSISPSSLSLYLKCPLRFWFAHIRDLKAPDEIEEQLNPGQIGSLFHLTLENLFEPLEGSDLLPEHWNALSEQIPQAWDKACEHTDFKRYSFDHGVNVLVKRMGLQFLQEYFRSEIKRSQHERIRLLGQELKFKATLKVDNLTIVWKGRLDRLETNAGKARIVDFKSGNMTRNSKELDLESLETSLDGEHDKAFQLLCYAWLAHANPQPLRRNKEMLQDPIPLPLELGIVPLQQASGGTRLLKVGNQKEMDLHMIKGFENLLRGIIRQILDPQQPILQTEDESRCKFCDFNRICRRSSDD